MYNPNNITKLKQVVLQMANHFVDVSGAKTTDEANVPVRTNKDCKTFRVFFEMECFVELFGVITPHLNSFHMTSFVGDHFYLHEIVQFVLFEFGLKLLDAFVLAFVIKNEHVVLRGCLNDAM
jgi:hypothetical protein